jgi:hypothetical protein
MIMLSSLILEPEKNIDSRVMRYLIDRDSNAILAFQSIDD